MPKEINILLLGETGVGKSTFINSFVNYLRHSSLDEAMASDLCYLIPTAFTITDDNYEDRIIGIGPKDDRNENTKIGESSTQGARAYEFIINELTIRLIDTPGIGDCRGITLDNQNFENVLSYIGEFNELHAICFLLKPDVPVINPYFKFCITHLLSRLEVSASKNIVFLFTCTRSTCYRPGQTLKNVRTILADIKKEPPFVEVPCTKQNIFCLDNEAFKFLVCLKRDMIFSTEERKAFEGSWEHSAESSRHLLNYIMGDSDSGPGLEPHNVKATISVNNARRSIIQLSQPLRDMADLIRDNLKVLENHRNLINEKNISIADLQKNLFVPSVNIETTPLEEPGIICTSSSCCTEYMIAGIQKVHYKQICAKPVKQTGLSGFLKAVVDGVQMVVYSLTHLFGTCESCGCPYSTHHFITYETKLTDERVEDESVATKIRTEEEKIKAQKITMAKLEERRKEYEHEEKVISKCMAKFAHFLQNNSISPYNDSYGEYLDHLIARENGAVNERVTRYEEMKKQYEDEKNALNQAREQNLKFNPDYKAVTADDITNAIEEVKALKLTGEKVRNLEKQEDQSRKKYQDKSFRTHKANIVSRNFQKLLNLFN